MDKELQSKLVEILGSIQTAAGKAGDFALSQLPDIAQSYVAYGRAYTLIIAALGIVIFLGGFYCVHWVGKKHAQANKQYAEALVAYAQKEEAGKKSSNYSYMSSEPYRHHFFEASDFGPIPYMPFVIGLVIFAMNISQTLLVWFAPKVWLLRELTALVK